MSSQDRGRPDHPRRRTPRHPLVATSLAGCTAGGASGGGAAGDAASWIGVGFVVGFKHEFNTMDPLRADYAQTNIVDNIVYEPLIKFDAAQDNKMVGALAGDFAVADDAKSISFTLRDGVTFYDGTADREGRAVQLRPLHPAGAGRRVPAAGLRLDHRGRRLARRDPQGAERVLHQRPRERLHHGGRPGLQERRPTTRRAGCRRTGPGPARSGHRHVVRRRGHGQAVRQVLGIRRQAPHADGVPPHR